MLHLEGKDTELLEELMGRWVVGMLPGAPPHTVEEEAGHTGELGWAQEGHTLGTGVGQDCSLL